MTADIHTCSYYCERPGCVRAQRDELRDRMEAVLSQQPAAVAVDEGSRSVAGQLLHWGGVPVRVTGTVTTSPGNWSLIDAALATQEQEGDAQMDALDRELAEASEALWAERAEWKSIAEQQPAAVDAGLAQRIQALVGGVEVDLEAPLSADANATAQTHGAMLRQLEPQLQEQLAEYEYTIAAQEAEIKALRAEVERLRADRDSWEQQASDRVADWYAEHLRAERLAEALRELVEVFSESGMYDEEVFAKARAALGQEEGE